MVCAAVDRGAGLAANIPLFCTTTSEIEAEGVSQPPVSNAQSGPLSGALSGPALGQVLKRLDATRKEALERLFELIRIPSISTDPQFARHCRRAADWCMQQLTDIGFDAKV